MESEQIISQLQTHNLLDAPEIKKQFDDALQNENNNNKKQKIKKLLFASICCTVLKYSHAKM